MKVSQIKVGGIYKNHDPKVSPREVTSIHSDGGNGRDKEVWYIEAATLKSGIATIGQMAEWATERVDSKNSKAA